MPETIKTTRIDVTDEELLLLDGECRPEIQNKIDNLKDALKIQKEVFGVDPEISKFVVAVVEEAKTSGRLGYRCVYITRCPVCGRTDGYQTHKRTSRWHRRGTPNYEKPNVFGGRELHIGCVSIRNRATLGCCDECMKKATPLFMEHLIGIKAEMPQELTGVPPQYKWYQKRKCTKCGWEGHEGEMGKERTLMGDGWYPAKCPKCPAKNEFLSTPIDIADGFVVVENAKSK